MTTDPPRKENGLQPMRHISAAMQVNGSPVDLLPPVDQITTFASGHPVHASVISVSALAVLVFAYFAVRAAYRAASHGVRKFAENRPAEDILTIIAASIATIVSAQGMWQFVGRIIGDVHWSLRGLMFAFLEIAVVTSAVRAKRNMRENYSAGIDGAAVWGLTGLSAVLSALEAASIPEFLFRLAAPLVAAWLWERGMAIERHRITGRSGINWRLTPERAAVWFGLAEAKDRTASEVDTHRRLTRVALAAKKVHQLRQAGAKDKKLQAAIAKRDRALDQAVEHTDLARDPAKQAALLDLVTTLGGADSLSGVLENAQAPWALLDHPAVTGAAKDSEAVRLAASLDEWTAAIEREREGDREVSAAVTSMAAYIAGRHLPHPGSATQTGTWPEVAPDVTAQVAVQVPPAPPVALWPASAAVASDTTSATPTATVPATWRQVADQVAPQVSDEVSDAEVNAIIAALRDTETDTADDTETATASATEAMRRHWDTAITEGRVPSGAELARVGGCVESYGRRMRNAWLDEMDGRTRRRLLNAKKASA